jgi:hypothetical protein
MASAVSLISVEEGKFLQRSVELGPLAGESCPVRKGLPPAEVAVIKGSFFLRIVVKSQLIDAWS